MKQFGRVLITGGTGFIGSNFIRYLLRRTWDVGRGTCETGRGAIKIINLDKLTYSGNLENLKDVENDSRYKFVKGDICDKKLVERLMKGCDAVINFAAESHVDRSIRESREFIRTNVSGTQVLLDAARKCGIGRFIQISTDEVYGSIGRGRFKENAPLSPNSPYAASKASADLLVRSYWITYKMPVIIVRSSNNFGPFQYPEKVIPLFITNALQNRKLPLYADGRNVREWIYVTDNCSAITFILESGIPGEVYNIGTGYRLKNIVLTGKILKILGKDKNLIRFVKDRPGHDKRYSLNSDKLKSLGWKPERRFGDALQETIMWYKENEKWWKRLEREEKFW